MKITLKRTPEQVELIKAMASRNRNVAYEAQVGTLLNSSDQFWPRSSTMHLP